MNEERRQIKPTECAFGTFSAEMTLSAGMFDREELRRKADRTHLLMGASLYLALMGLGVADQRWPKGSRQMTVPFSGSLGNIFSVELAIPLDLNLDIPEDALYSVVTGNVISPVLNAIGYSIDERDHLVPTPEASLAALGDTTTIDRMLRVHELGAAEGDAPMRAATGRRAATRSGS